MESEESPVPWLWNPAGLSCLGPHQEEGGASGREMPVLGSAAQQSRQVKGNNYSLVGVPPLSVSFSGTIQLQL